MEIRKLQKCDAAAFWQLRLEALSRDPDAFAESDDEHRQTTVEAFADRLRTGGTENFVFGAFDDGSLVGTAGFYREQRIKRRHKGGVWGVYVTTPYRGRGIARLMMESLLDEARRLPDLHSIHLSVTTTQPTARRLYESLGFRTIGVEPAALRTPSGFIDEALMVLTLGDFQLARITAPDP